MSICPFCNGLDTVQLQCSFCGNILLDYGKSMDYFDTYSPYEPQEVVECVDGLSHEDNEIYCMHILYCQTCLQEFEIPLLTK
ncbi:hypothetical protein [Ectobacillus polymachus]|uniref:hypothetical protein n=1 Tax=Ectobacillus polymachus TaxID=1508806 RepID=UPI003A883975